MILTVRSDFARYRIECPPDAQVKRDEDVDFLIVSDPDDPETTLALFDDILLDAAQNGDFGLRVLSLEPLN